MIRYALVCAEDHRFEAWFRDSEAFDDQCRDGQIDCPACGSSDVRKALMAPAIRRRSSRHPALEADAQASAGSPVPPRPGSGTQLPVAMPAPTPPEGVDDERFRQMRSLLRELHAKVKETAENVGASFSDEARRIHAGEAQARPIYGTAIGQDVRALIEEGIEILPLPPLPDDGN